MIETKVIPLFGRPEEKEEVQDGFQFKDITAKNKANLEKTARDRARDNADLVMRWQLSRRSKGKKPPGGGGNPGGSPPAGPAV